MKRRYFVPALCCLTVALAPIKAADKTEVGSKTKSATRAPAGDNANDNADDEKLLRKLADDFVKAFNDHDARAIAGQFAPRAEMVDLDGNVVQGRQAIQEFYDKHFQNSDLKFAIQIESLRFIGDDFAIEDGHLTFFPAGEDEKHAQRSPYTVVHAREDGKWLIISSRDVFHPRDRAPPHEHLMQLAWLVGDWVEEGGDSMVSTTYRWDDSKNYLLSDYTVKVAGQTTMSGTQRIGWDPLTKQIKTWTFDADGGHGEGYWHRDGDRWLVKLTGVAADGRIGSVTQIHTPHSDHARTWSAVDRLLGGERLPDIEEITIVRAAPRPRKAAAKPGDN